MGGADMGKVLKHVLKVLAGIVVIAAAALYVVVNHSAARQELVCKGHWKDAPEASDTAYVQLNEYRPWIRLWSGPHGDVKVQTDKRAEVGYFEDVRRTGEGRLALYSFWDYDFQSNKLTKFRGGYRAANNEITMEFWQGAIFIGTCELNSRPS